MSTATPDIAMGSDTPSSITWSGGGSIVASVAMIDHSRSCTEVAHLSGESSNPIFLVLAEWEALLKPIWHELDRLER